MWIVIAAFSCVLAILLIVSLFLQTYSRKLKFRDRPIMTIDNWYSKFYGNSGLSIDLTRQACEALAKDIGVNTTQIYPTDRFDQDLTFTEWWGWGKYADELVNFDSWLDKYLRKNLIKPPTKFSSNNVYGLLTEIKEL